MSEQDGMEGEIVRIPLDGSYGCGAQAVVTIYTRIPKSDDVHEETFQFPYALIDQGKLMAYNSAHLIAGFRILKLEKPSALRELGL